MGVTIVSMGDAHRDAMRMHLRTTRSCDWPDAQLAEYIDWRYFRRERAETLLALADGRCVAMLDSVIRRYAATGGGGFVDVREPAEWFCLPEYRPLGLGLRVLRKMMTRTEPILAIRGTPDTQVLLPKLGWEQLADVVLLNATRGWRNRLQEATARLLRAGRVTGVREADFRVTYTPPTQADLDDVAAAARAFTPLLCTWEREWFSKAPAGVGDFFWVRVERQGACHGYALGRVYQGAARRRGKIVHVAALTPAVLEALISATVEQFRRRSIDHIAARASDPGIVAAYRTCGFTPANASQPVFWWKGSGESITPQALALSYLRGDDSIRPLSLALEA